MTTILHSALARVSSALIAAFTAASLFAAAGPAPNAPAATCPSREAFHAAGKAARIRGWTHTCGNRIVDSRRHVVRPVSVTLWNFASDVGRNSRVCTHWWEPSSYVYTNLKNWGFNSVLLYISWANVENRAPTHRNGHLVHHYNQTYLRAVSRAVNRFGNHGIKVILAMVNNRWSSAFTNLALPNGFHIPCGFGMPVWLYKSSSSVTDMVRAEKNFFNSPKLMGWFTRAWRTVAHRFRRNPTVIGADVLHEAYDILAQPYPGSDGIGPKALHLAGFYERVGRGIHKSNRHLLIMTNEWHTWKKPGFWAVTRKPRVPNGVEIFEFYAGNWNSVGIGRMKLYRGRANNWHRPLWVEEFYAFLPTGGGPPNTGWATYSKGFLSYTKQRHVGWAFGPYGRLADATEYRYVGPSVLLSVLRKGF
jgi:hypothetical protein